MLIVVNKHLCPQNHPCPAVKVCPVEAITQVNCELPKIDPDKCIKCGKCVIYCPMGAIQKEEE